MNLTVGMAVVALIGAVIGGLMTLGGTLFTLRHQRRADADRPPDVWTGPTDILGRSHSSEARLQDQAMVSNTGWANDSAYRRLTSSLLKSLIA